MSILNIKIIKSNIDEYVKENVYQINLIKCIGYGSYGYIFKINDFFCIKILLDPITVYDNKYSDYNEAQIVAKIINNNFSINCSNYSIGLIEETDYLYNNEKINIFVNKERLLQDSYVIKNKKLNKFAIMVKYSVLIMPLFVSIKKYDLSIINTDEYIIKLIDILINAQKEFLSIGLINLDYKLSNTVIDSLGNIRFIDFGIIKNLININYVIDNKNRYFLWHRFETINLNMTYMIGVYILEILYGDIYLTRDNPNLIEITLYKFLDLDYFSNAIKNIIEELILDKIDWADFLDKFNKIKLNYDIENIKIPFNRLMLL